MASVMRSAYRKTCALTFLAHLPMVWMRLVAERRKPSLSASSIATRDTSGRSSPDRKSTRLNSSHVRISYAVFCLKKKKKKKKQHIKEKKKKKQKKNYI